MGTVSYEVEIAHEVTLENYQTYVYKDYELARYCYIDSKPRKGEVVMLVHYYTTKKHGVVRMEHTILNRKYHPQSSWANSKGGDKS